MGSDSRMHPLGPGDRGPAVADVHSVLRGLGLLPPVPEPTAGNGTSSPSDDADGALYDQATELAVRHFQQVRGLSVDGRVGEETYRALNECGASLGDRLLRYDPVRPTRGDDVISLHESLHELGYDAGAVDRVFAPVVERG